MKNRKNRKGRKNRHCKNCAHVKTVEGEVTKNFNYIKERHECTNGKVKVEYMEKYDWNPDKLAQHCRHFLSKKIKECAKCKEKMDEKITEWDLWGETPFGLIPVCSKECKKEVEKQIIEDEKEDRNDEAIIDFYKKKGLNDMQDLDDTYHDYDN